MHNNFTEEEKMEPQNLSLIQSIKNKMFDYKTIENSNSKSEHFDS